MQIDRAGLEVQFREMSDGELLERIASGVLTELAAEVARAEARGRGLESQTDGSDDAGRDQPGGVGPLRICATFMNPLVAEALKVRLLAEGLDALTHYANGGVMGSVGLAGVRVMVPESQFEDASRVREAFDAGEYAIGEDFDVNP